MSSTPTPEQQQELLDAGISLALVPLVAEDARRILGEEA